jgi:hypothetical protein
MWNAKATELLRYLVNNAPKAATVTGDGSPRCRCVHYSGLMGPMIRRNDTGFRRIDTADAHLDRPRPNVGVISPDRRTHTHNSRLLSSLSSQSQLPLCKFSLAVCRVQTHTHTHNHVLLLLLCVLLPAEGIHTHTGLFIEAASRECLEARTVPVAGISWPLQVCSHRLMRSCRQRVTSRL